MSRFEQGEVRRLREDNEELDTRIAEMRNELRAFIGLARWGLAFIEGFVVVGFSASIWLTTQVAWRSSDSMSLNPPYLILNPPKLIRVETVSLPKPIDKVAPPTDVPPGLADHVTTPPPPR